VTLNVFITSLVSGKTSFIVLYMISQAWFTRHHNHNHNEVIRNGKVFIPYDYVIMTMTVKLTYELRLDLLQVSLAFLFQKKNFGTVTVSPDKILKPKVSANFRF